MPTTEIGEHRTRPGQLVRLLVVERGAAPIALAPADGVDQTILVIQQDEEPPIDFSIRIIERLRLIERAGLRVECATLQVAPNQGDQAMAVRALLARALRAHSLVAGSLDLVFAVTAETSVELCRMLMTLVQEFVRDPGESPTLVRVFLKTLPEVVRDGNGAAALRRDDESAVLCGRV